VSSLAAGINTALWWIRKKPSRSILATLAIGVAVGLFVLTATSSDLVGIASSAFASLALADVASSGTSLLAGIVHP
jgi:hypothetical protein